MVVKGSQNTNNPQYFADEVSPDWETPKDILGDLKMLLDGNMQHIITRYSAYIRCICVSLEANGVSAVDLAYHLLTASAFSHSRQKIMPMSTNESELMEATNLNKIVLFLAREYASFLNCSIFEFIVNAYSIDKGQEELRYPVYLRDYIQCHKLSEFVKINPLLTKWAASKKFVLLMDIETTSRLAKIFDLKQSIAQILGISLGAIILLDYAT